MVSLVVMEETTPGTELPADRDPGDVAFNLVAASCWSLVTPTAIVTNTFTLVVVHRSAKEDDINYIFIGVINLFILLFCLCFALPATVSSIAGGQWILGHFLCTVQSLLIIYLHTVGAFLLFSYSLERFMFLLYPLRYPGLITVRRVRLLIGCIFLLPFLAVPLWGFLSDWQGVYVPSCHVCAPYSDPVVNKAIFVSFSILLSVVPSVVAYIVHAALLLTARQHLRRIIAGIPQSVARPNGDTTGEVAVTGHQLHAAAIDRKIQVNKSQLISITIILPLTIGIYLTLDLALFGFDVQRYVVLLSNLSIFSAPTLLGLKAMLNSRALKQSAKQLFSCCCKPET